MRLRLATTREKVMLEGKAGRLRSAPGVPLHVPSLSTPRQPHPLPAGPCLPLPAQPAPPHPTLSCSACPSINLHSEPLPAPTCPSTPPPLPLTLSATEEGLLLRPVDVRSTAVKDYDDPLRVDESIVFYRVSVDDNRRFLSNGAGAGDEEEEGGSSEYSSSEERYSSEEQQQQQQYEEQQAGGSGSSDWQAVQDDQGRTYYYNAVTGVTQWEVPDELA